MLLMRFFESVVTAVILVGLTLSPSQGQETWSQGQEQSPCDLPSASSVKDQHPPLFSLVLNCPGVSVYQHESAVVQVIGLDQGASLHFLSGKITDSGQDQGVYGGDDPQLFRETVKQAWSGFIQAYPQGVCLANGQFFRNDTNEATGLAFPVKGDDWMSDGYAGETEYASEKLMLEVWPDFAEIKPFTPELMQTSTAPNFIVGLTATADKGPERVTGRTFMGIKDGDGNGRSETVLILTGQSLTQSAATEILEDFGAGHVMMLDGGDSTQLVCQGISYVESSRTVPQMMGVTLPSSPQ